MSEPNWADEAVRHAANVIRMNPARDRGVFDSDHRGVSVVFAPHGELGRITEGLTGEGIEVLGVGTSPSTSGYNVAALVRSTDRPTLEAILTTPDRTE